MGVLATLVAEDALDVVCSVSQVMRASPSTCALGANPYGLWLNASGARRLWGSASNAPDTSQLNLIFKRKIWILK